MEGEGRFKRLLTLRTLLEQDRYNSDELARLSGISKRTLYRDLQVLKDCGVPIVFDRHRRAYSLQGPHEGPVPPLTAEELGALGKAEQALDEPDRTLARRALAKLRASLPPQLKHTLGQRDRVCRSSGGHRRRLVSHVRMLLSHSR